MRTWKLWLALAIAAGVLGFAAYRMTSAFRDRPPAAFGIENQHSPRVARDPDPDLPWTQLSAFFQDVQRLSQSQNLKIGSVQFVELNASPSQTVFWTTLRLVNPGFSPMDRFEEPAGPKESTLLGFYSVAGEPLDYAVKRSPGRPDWRALTVQLAEPLAPGATGYIWRRERRPATVSAERDDSWVFGPGPLSARDRELQGRAVRLPTGASLVDYRPRAGAATGTATTPVVAWISFNLEPDAPNPAVTYRIVK